MTIWHLGIACWIPKATNTLSEQWLHECALLYLQCLSCLANIDMNMLPVSLKAAFAIDLPFLKPHFCGTVFVICK